MNIQCTSQLDGKSRAMFRLTQHSDSDECITFLGCSSSFLCIFFLIHVVQFDSEIYRKTYFFQWFLKVLMDFCQSEVESDSGLWTSNSNGKYLCAEDLLFLVNTKWVLDTVGKQTFAAQFFLCLSKILIHVYELMISKSHRTRKH